MNHPMILSAFFFNPQGDHRMSWRHPRAPGREIFGLEYYRQLAIAAENAVIDIVFVADHVAIWDSVRKHASLITQTHDWSPSHFFPRSPLSQNTLV